MANNICCINRQLLSVCSWEIHKFQHKLANVPFYEKYGEQNKPIFSYSVANEVIRYF
jgi:hypothetical protein